VTHLLFMNTLGDGSGIPDEVAYSLYVLPFVVFHPTGTVLHDQTTSISSTSFHWNGDLSMSRIKIRMGEGPKMKAPRGYGGFTERVEGIE